MHSSSPAGIQFLGTTHLITTASAWQELALQVFAEAMSSPGLLAPPHELAHTVLVSL